MLELWPKFNVIFKILYKFYKLPCCIHAHTSTCLKLDWFYYTVYSFTYESVRMTHLSLASFSQKHSSSENCEGISCTPCLRSPHRFVFFMSGFWLSYSKMVNKNISNCSH